MSAALETPAIANAREHDFGEHVFDCDGWPGNCALCAAVAICIRCGVCEADDVVPLVCSGRDAGDDARIVAA